MGTLGYSEGGGGGNSPLLLFIQETLICECKQHCSDPIYGHFRRTSIVDYKGQLHIKPVKQPDHKHRSY